jgi:hypothetical protein
MKNLLFILCLFGVVSSLAQSHGITYQAVLIAETDQELPGIDVPGSIMPNRSIELRFSIRGSGGVIYQERQQTTTDDYGLINLVIGEGEVTAQSPTSFVDIDWDGRPMSLVVEIDLQEGSGFKDFSEQALYFVPYAFHKDITTTGTLDVAGVTTLSSDLIADSDLHLSGEANIDGSMIIGSDLTVEGETSLAALSLDGNLTVAGITNLNDILSVNNNVPTFLSGTLEVEQAANFLATITAEGTATFNDLTTVNNNLMVSTDNASAIARFINSNSDGGDGIIIKLGKARTTLTPPSLPSVSTEMVTQMKNLLRCDIAAGDKITILGDIAIEGVTEDAQMVAGIIVGLGNSLIEIINDELGLPAGIPETDILLELLLAINGGGPTSGFCSGVGDCLIPDELVDPSEDEYLGGYLVLPAFTFPAIPEIDLSDFGVEAIDLEDPDFWGIPSLCLQDSGSPLSNQNEFISFLDANDSKMGSIRAVSVVNWTANYLNPTYLYNLKGALTSSVVDKKHARYHFKQEVSKMLFNYKDIGVEYSSGNGDYAEWLERELPEEVINPGEVVGVRGGKIAKDLTNAEQVMVVSHYPIVLGNMPDEKKLPYGNNVAFMGQVPVKVIGKVQSGDYIVGHTAIPGFARAIRPENITAEDLVLTVGRSWESSEDDGPKFINTVIGVHNGEYLKILQRFEQRLDASEARLQSLESKLDVLTDALIKTSN